MLVSENVPVFDGGRYTHKLEKLAVRRKLAEEAKHETIPTRCDTLPVGDGTGTHFKTLRVCVFFSDKCEACVDLISCRIISEPTRDETRVGMIVLRSTGLFALCLSRT